MGNLQSAIENYRQQLKHGHIQVAYRGIMEYLQALKHHFQVKYPHFSLPGSLYFGYMDMTYFAILTPALQQRRLKVAVVFLHEQFRFEAWLAAVNKQVQAEYWQKIKVSGWDRYPLVPSTRCADAILEHILVAEPDFSDLPSLTAQIETSTLDFIASVENFLSTNQA